MGAFSDVKRAKARSGIVERAVVVAEGQAAAGIARVPIFDRGTSAVDDDIGRYIIVNDHTAADRGITADGDAAFGDPATVRLG